MRVLGLVVLCAWAASAQTSVAGRGTVGLSAEREGAAAVSAVEVLLERSFQSSLSVSAHLVALVLATPGSLNFQDLGSSVRVQLRLADWDTEALFLELFPFDSRRVRPAFDFANQWDRPTRPTTVAPVLRLGFARHNTSVWAALRGHQQLDRMLGGNNPAGAIGTRVGVMRKDGTLSILPSGAQAQVELQATASLLFNRFDLLSALLLIHYGRDPNTSDFRDAVSGATEPTRALAQTWRVELLAQLRF